MSEFDVPEAGHGAADDTADDNVVTTEYIDYDGDGGTDVQLIDTDGDYVADEERYDINRDGVTDVVYLDHDGDGYVDEARVDLDGDGVADHTAHQNPFPTA